MINKLRGWGCEVVEKGGDLVRISGGKSPCLYLTSMNVRIVCSFVKEPNNQNYFR
jgi:hypothetical protein